ncbi:MAG: hypothetical protein EXS48_01745 [Candidatus Staskawiczbacteria bacterium]|nr:hypothetical protein [Candidatus Staskawiczbacteria bacterium]
MGFISPLSKATCPFCFHRFHLSKAPRRATDPTLPQIKDIKMGKFLGRPGLELGMVTEPSEFSWAEKFFGKVFIADDWKSGCKKICPDCHMYLPHATASGQLNSKTIAIIGARNSGKSNYFGVLLNELEKRYANEVGFTIYDQETYSIREEKQVSSKQLYRVRYGSSLYGNEKRVAIGQSFNAIQNADLRIPLIYRLEFPKTNFQKLFSFFTPVISMDLVIFDAAGENLEDPVAIEQVCRHLLNASGIIFLIDPFQFDYIREKMYGRKEDAKKTKIDFDAADMISSVVNLFEKRGGLKPGNKVPIPAAFAFSKSDLLESLVDKSSSLLKYNSHQGGFNLKKCLKLSEEVIECTKEWESPRMYNLARSKFKSYCFFALSALGQSPGSNMEIERVVPKNVADPLLWLLWKNGYIPSV